MPLSPQDELIHPIASEPTWREAYYFDWFDPASRLCAFGYIGVHPNQQLGDVIFALWRGDLLLARFTRWDFNIPSDIGEERLAFGPLHFRPIEPFRAWEMSYDDGFCRMDVTFHGIHPPYFWADSHGALASTNSHHYEQQGRYQGTVRVGGEFFPVAAAGCRDHAWGWGARAGIRRWMWASAQFSEDFCWNTFQVTLADQRDILYGYIFRGGQNRFVRSSRVTAEYASLPSPTGLMLEISADNGDRVSARGRILNVFDTSFQERNKTGYHFFCFTEYECEGRTGYGQSNFHWRTAADRPQDWSVKMD